MFATCKEPGRSLGVAVNGDVSADAVLAASRALVAMTARSLTAVDGSADVMKMRVLVLVTSRGAVSLRQVAEVIGMHVSTASRLCDRMVAEGLLDRSDDPADRRQLALRPTVEGSRLVNAMLNHRRRAVGRVLDRMTGQQRDQLTAGLKAFADAAGEVAEGDLWAIGWTR
jgi:DNA-binding MarR family transcriptional regulator